MDKFQQNTESELLTLLLDGELEATQEQKLFEGLSNNSELQEEMQHQLMIRESVRNDVEAFAPPPSTTNTIFSSLGYTSPLTPKETIWNAIFGKKRAAVAFVFLAVFTSGIFLINSDNSKLAIHDNNISGIINDEITQSIKSNYTKSINSEVIFRNENNNDYPIVKSGPIASSITSKNTINQIATNKTNSANIDSGKQDKSSQIVSLEQSPIELNPQTISFNSNFGFSTINRSKRAINYSKEENRFMITLRNNYNSTLNESMFGTDLNNYTLGAFYSVNKYIQVGAEFGFQNFNRMRSTDGINPPEEVQTNVMIITAGIIHQAEYAKMFNIATPYFKAMIGSQTGFGGFHSIIGAGFNLDINNSFGLNFGFDRNSINYSVDNINQWTGNNNLTFGLMYKF